MDRNWRGSPKATPKNVLTRLLKLAKASKKDVFCDLGCGYGNLCIYARKFVGESIEFETKKYRYKIAKSRAEKSSFNKIRIYPISYENPKSIQIIKNCSIIFTVNSISKEYLEKLAKHGRKCKKIILYDFPPAPIQPYKKFGGYFIIKTPFKLAQKEKNWIKSVTKNKFNKRSDLHLLIKRDFYDWRKRIKYLEKDLQIFENKI